MRLRASKRAALGIVALGWAAHGGGSATAQPFSPGWTFRSDALYYFTILGDVNGDGYDEVAIGFYRTGGTNFECPNLFLCSKVYAGSPNGPLLTSFWLLNDVIAPRSAGDVNGDGFDDVIAPAYQAANVYHGSASGLPSAPSWSVSRPGNDGFGSQVAGVGDVNGDGYDDLLVNAPTFSNGEDREGAAYVFLGSATGLASTAHWTVEGGQVRAGLFAGPAGDINGDGYDDVGVGLPGFDGINPDDGQARVYLGSPAGLSGAPAWTVTGSGPYPLPIRFGAIVAASGDLDGDGYDEVVVGRNTSSVQSMDIFHGSAAGPGLIAHTVLAGVGVRPVGDMDGDGYDDLLVGKRRTPTYNTVEHESALHRGSSAGLSSTASWRWVNTFASGGETQCFPGSAGGGDVNGGGRPDILLGYNCSAPGFPLGGEVQAFWAEPTPRSFYAIPPCRVVDTRPAEALGANSSRRFPVGGNCQVPSDAAAAVLNVTAVAPSDLGNLRVFPAWQTPPPTSVVNFGPGVTRAAHAVVPLGPHGWIDVQCDMPEGSPGSTHLVVDVFGYFK